MASPLKYTLNSVLEDSRQLANRMRARDENFDSFICRSQSIKDFLNEKKKAQEGTINLRELANRIPPQRTLGAYVLCVAAENEQLEKLREENRILSQALEEHQTVLDLIMSKYRSQMTQCLYLSGQEKSAFYSSIEEDVKERKKLLQLPTTDSSNCGEIKNNNQLKKQQKDEIMEDENGILQNGVVSNNNLILGTSGLTKRELSSLVQTLYQRIHRLTQLSHDSIQTASEMAAQMEARIQQLESENANLRHLLTIDEKMRLVVDNNNISTSVHSDNGGEMDYSGDSNKKIVGSLSSTTSIGSLNNGGDSSHGGESTRITANRTHISHNRINSNKPINSRTKNDLQQQPTTTTDSNSTTTSIHHHPISSTSSTSSSTTSATTIQPFVPFDTNTSGMSVNIETTRK